MPFGRRHNGDNLIFKPSFLVKSVGLLSSFNKDEAYQNIGAPTEFDIDVGDAGQTVTRVRSGLVTFETRFMGLTHSDPIKLTANGLNRASAKESSLTREVRPIVTKASGSQGQFFGVA